MPEFTQLPWCKAVVFIAIAAAGILALSHTTLRGRTRGGDSTVLGSVMEMDTVGGIAKASVGGGAALRNKHSTTRGSRAHRAHMHNTADGSQVDILEEDDIVASDSASGSGYEWVYEYRSETVTLTGMLNSVFFLVQIVKPFFCLVGTLPTSHAGVFFLPPKTSRKGCQKGKKPLA